MPDFNNGVQISPGYFGGTLSDPNMTSAPSLPSIYNTNPSSPSAAPWANFRFQNPTSPFQQNFNSLAAQDPNAAFSYGFTGRGGPGAASNSNDLRHALDAAGYNSAGILGAYNRGSFDPTSGMGKSIGMPSDWNTPSGYLDRTGSSFNFNGNSYNLQNPEAAANTKVGYNGGGGVNAPGGSSWWDAVKQFQQTQGGPPTTTPVAPPSTHMNINNPVNTTPISGYGGGLGRVYNQQPVNTQMQPTNQPFNGHLTSGGLTR